MMNGPRSVVKSALGHGKWAKGAHERPICRGLDWFVCFEHGSVFAGAGEYDQHRQDSHNCDNKSYSYAKVLVSLYLYAYIRMLC
jgi:hypothetical protein